MKKNNRYNYWCVLAAATCSFLFQGGCAGFWQREMEALFAPAIAGNALYVLDSAFFDLLASLIY